MKTGHSLILLILAGLLQGLTSCRSAPETAPSIPYDTLELPERPNILWIVAEDLSPFLPPFGDSTVATPNLSRLAAEGVRYPNLFSPSGVCAPSRAAIALGMYPTRIGAMHMRTGPWHTFNVSEETLRNQRRPPYEALPPAGVHMHSEYLRRAGYYCSNNRKEDYQFRREMTAWDQSDRWAHWRGREPGQPFFAIFNLMETHESRLWIKSGDSLWVDENLDVPVPPYLPATDVGRQNIRRLYSNIVEMDYQVGLILDELAAADLLDSTVIFWYSDHGGPLPRHKRTVYDTGLRAPMIIRFPGAQLAGRVDSQLLSFIDLKPTLLSLAGIEPPGYLDGRAWLGPYASEEPRKYIHAAADRFDDYTDRIRAVRDYRYKYIRNFMPAQSYYLPIKYREEIPLMQELLRLKEEGRLDSVQALWFRERKDPEELFDTWTDPYELHNLAGDPAYANKLAELRLELDRWIEEMDDKGMIPEEAYVRSIWPGGEQPVTATPRVRREGDQWVITTATEEAAIGYQWIEPGAEPGDRWEIYRAPIPNEPGQTLIVRAHRIGFLPSEMEKVSPE